MGAPAQAWLDPLEEKVGVQLARVEERLQSKLEMAVERMVS